MVKGVIFDLDDTLYNYQFANEKALNALCQYASEVLRIPAATFRDAFMQGRAQTKKDLSNTAATHSRSLYCQHALEILGLSPLEYTVTLSDYFWNSFFSHMCLYPGVKEFLEKLKRSKYSIALCTDMTAEIQHKKVFHLGLEELVDHIVTSEEVGYEKPHPKMFSMTLEKMSLNPSEVVMIGDSLQKDIQGAKSLGIQAYFFTNLADKSKVAPMCHIFEDYRELLHDRAFFAEF